MGMTPTETDDIQQDTIMNLHKNIHKVDNPGAYVQSVCYRRCVDLIRRKSVRKEESYMETYSDDEHSDTAQAASAAAVVRHHVQKWVEQCQSDDEASAQMETLTVLKDRLSKIGEPCKALLSDRFYGEMSYKELAEKHSKPETQVGVYVSRCLEKLKKLLQEDGDIWSNLTLLWNAKG